MKHLILDFLISIKKIFLLKIRLRAHLLGKPKSEKEILWKEKVYFFLKEESDKKFSLENLY